MKVLGCIIAGGKSTRMGQNKALMQWRDKPLIAHVVDRLTPQVAQLIVNTNGDAASFAFLHLPIIADLVDMETPLAGLHAALSYAHNHRFDAVLTAPCDTPLLPVDLCERLEGEGPAVAASGDQVHYLTGFWPVGVLALFKQPPRRVMDFAASVAARQVTWPASDIDPFLNLNTQDDVVALDRMLL